MDGVLAFYMIFKNEKPDRSDLGEKVFDLVDDVRGSRMGCQRLLWNRACILFWIMKCKPTGERSAMFVCCLRMQEPCGELSHPMEDGRTEATRFLMSMAVPSFRSDIT